MEDKKLLRLLKKDPCKGMEQMMSLYSALLYTVVKGKLQGSYYISSDVEDLVADTFSEFFLELDRYDPSVSSIKSYLCVLARHNAADLLRKRQKQRAEIPIEEAELSGQMVIDSFIESELAEKELRQAVMAEIRLLGHPDADILWRKYYLCQSAKEIAEALDLSVSAVDTRTHRAVKKLQKLMGGSKNEKELI